MTLNRILALLRSRLSMEYSQYSISVSDVVVVSSVSMECELHDNRVFKKPSWIYTGTKEFEVQYYEAFNSCIYYRTFETQMDLCNSTISIFSKQF